MNMMLWLFAGLAIGWLAFARFNLNAGWGLFPSLCIGAIGGLAGGKFLAPLFIEPPKDGIDLAALVIAAVCALAALLVTNLLHNTLS
ncbi:MAG TPA: hypothetical protein VEC19_10775 [Usitatibacter sp.]|nr:hypothetical protein [Usitatibacter sp.]